MGTHFTFPFSFSPIIYQLSTKMQLSTYFQTYVYHRTSASAVKAAEYLLRDALFPHGVLANAPDFEQFGVSERGHIFYRNHTLMKLA
ncbi:MAG: hypothetical protein ACKVTZ_07150, partial [Bacteroidia bacterium]